MSTARDARSDQRTARWIAPVGLWGGALCFLGGALFYLRAGLDPRSEQLLNALEGLAPATFAVLGTILVSVGAVFALLGRLGGLARVAARHCMDPEEPRRDLPSTEWRSGDSELAHVDTAAAAVIGVEPYRIGAAGPGSDKGGRNTSTDSVGPSPHHATAPTRGDALRPDPGVQWSEPPAVAGEAAEPSLPVDGPPPLEPPQPGDLIDAWDEYRRNGDGHFSPRGLQEVIDQWEFAARVVHGDRVNAGGAVLVVEAPGTPNFWVLPSFNESPRAVADWFDDASSGALTGRTQQVVRVARGRRLESGTGRCEVVERGEVR